MLAITTQFVTVTISAPLGRYAEPGNTDPAVPLAVADALAAAAIASETLSTSFAYMAYSMKWTESAVGMIRGSEIPWWAKGSSPDDMAYECDANLGSPLVTDCIQIEWNQLGPTSASPPSDTVAIGPGFVQFLHSSQSKPRYINS